jgi:hypothetical protein
MRYASIAFFVAGFCPCHCFHGHNDVGKLLRREPQHAGRSTRLQKKVENQTVKEAWHDDPGSFRLLRRTVEDDFFKETDDACHRSMSKLFTLIQFGAEVKAAQSLTLDREMLVSFADVAIGRRGENLDSSALSSLRWVNLARGLQAGVVWTVEDSEMMFDACFNKDPYDRLEEQNKAMIGTHEAHLLQGDMLVVGPREIHTGIAASLSGSSASLLEKGSAGMEDSRFAARTAYPWPNGKVQYCFHADLRQQSKAAFLLAIGTTQTQVPCLTFEEKEFDAATGLCTSSPAILVQSSQAGCWSHVGAVRSSEERHLQRMNLGRGCEMPGMAIHQLGHALGLVHTHTRVDRDKFINIHKENTDERKFNDEFPRNDEKPLFKGFDFFSVMLPGTRSFSKNANFSITTTNALLQKFIGQRMGFSQGDIDLLGSVYECPGLVKPSTGSAELSWKVSLGEGMVTDHTCKNHPHTGLMTRDEGAVQLREASCWDLEAKCRHDHFGIAVRNACPLTCLMCLPVDTSDPQAATKTLLSGRYEHAVRWLSYYDDLLPKTHDWQSSGSEHAFVSNLLQITPAQSVNAYNDSDALRSVLVENESVHGEAESVPNATQNTTGKKTHISWLGHHAPTGNALANGTMSELHDGPCIDKPYTSIRFTNGHVASCADLVNYCTAKNHSHGMDDQVKKACPLTCGLCALRNLSAEEFMNQTDSPCVDGKVDDVPNFYLQGSSASCKDLKMLCNTHPDPSKKEAIRNKCRLTCGLCVGPNKTSTIVAATTWEDDEPPETAPSKWTCARRRRDGWCVSRRRRADELVTGVFGDD